MRHHQQRLVASLQEAFEPLYHRQVQVVGRLVEYQEVGLGNEHVGQRHTLLLAARQLSHRLRQVTYLQLRQNLLGLQHLLRVTLMVEAGIEHTLLRVELRRLFEHAHADVATVDDVALVVTLVASQYAEQRRLARTVLGNQADVLSLGHRETDVLEQYQRTKRLRQMLYVQVGSVLSHSSATC